MTFQELKQKANSLPLVPGVYIMQDRTGQVIYVGKAKKLKNRVSQYFQDSASHSGKTRRMVSQIFEFNTIVAGSEFEALVLECSLIKRHMPRYNILLKDGKGYPYVRLDRSLSYPTMEMAGKTAEDGAMYFGPYGGRFITQQVLHSIRVALKLHDCSRVFPRDIGKERPCLNYHIGTCDGWCLPDRSQEEYRSRIDQAVQLLKGDYKKAASDLKSRMEQAAEELRFEEAASLRDRMKAIENLSQKQIVTAGSSALTDVIGYYANETRACFAVLHFESGNLLDKDYEILTPSDTAEDTVSALVKQYYLVRGSVPKEILLPVDMEDAGLFSELLLQTYGRRVLLRRPMRGGGVRLVELANGNAREEAERITTREERTLGTLRQFGQLIGLHELPKRLESYDISNTAGKDMVGSMVVFEDGKPKRSEYRSFKLRDLEDQDDYAAMGQVLFRRFTRYLNKDPKFSSLPDALLIDGGAAHAGAAEAVLQELGLQIPVFGMVKDDRHRTRGLVRSDNSELGLTANPALFAFVGRIQEETHRAAITHHKKLQGSHVRASCLEEIPGVGEKRRKLLLKEFKTIKAIREADLTALSVILPRSTAEAVYEYFHPREEEICES